MDGITYIEKLKEAYEKNGFKEKWNHLMSIANGISQEDKMALYAEYPDFPKALMDILQVIDGTYYREFKGEKVTYYFFGSDLDDGEYPYYLDSFKNIMDNRDDVKSYDYMFEYYFDEQMTEDFYIDERISSDFENLKWLHFSDCMNNGGSSSLYVDFTPSEKGKYGQIIRYVHDIDKLQVIADSFEEYLDMLVNMGMKFIHNND